MMFMDSLRGLVWAAEWGAVQISSSVYTSALNIDHQGRIYQDELSKLDVHWDPLSEEEKKIEPYLMDIYTITWIFFTISIFVRKVNA